MSGLLCRTPPGAQCFPAVSMVSHHFFWVLSCSLPGTPRSRSKAGSTWFWSPWRWRWRPFRRASLCAWPSPWPSGVRRWWRRTFRRGYWPLVSRGCEGWDTRFQVDRIWWDYNPRTRLNDTEWVFRWWCFWGDCCVAQRWFKDFEAKLGDWGSKASRGCP